MAKPIFFLTDVFTNTRYGGNQLATFFNCESLSDQEMQKIAKEINFSETTFIMSAENKAGGYDARIFTPTHEMDFAGHPTLGTAHVLRNKILKTESNLINLNLRIGQIPVSFSQTDMGDSILWMKQMSPQFGKTFEVEQLADVLSLKTADFCDILRIEEVSTGFPHIVVALKSLAAVRNVKINADKYDVLIKDAWAKNILVYSEETYELPQTLSVRVFAPYYGVAEDAATGSGNGCLAAYLVRHKVLGADSIDILTGQGYELGRPSTLALRASVLNGVIDVNVGGTVVDVAEGVWG